MTGTPRAPRPSRARIAAFTVLHALGSGAVSVATLGAVFPAVLLMSALHNRMGDGVYLVGAPLAAVIFVCVLAGEIVVAKWLLLGRVKPGTYPVHGSFYLRKWYFDQLMGVSLDVLGPIYASLYFAPWFRLLGARMGRNAEVSTAADTSPDLLDLGDESFIADGVSLGAAHVENGMVSLGETRVGNKAFVGNSAWVPSGTTLGDDSLIGVLSAPPLGSPDAATPGSAWLGSPAIFLPQRQASTAFSPETTYRPTRTLVLTRALIEALRVVLPVTMFVVLTSVLIHEVSWVRDFTSSAVALAVFPLMYAAGSLAACAVVVLAKWALMGRYGPGERPLWCHFVWFNELVTALHEHVANPLLVEPLLGTPFAAWFFRAMGCRIGKRVYLGTTQFTEYDLVDVGDDVALGEDCTVQTHLFEDRVMKMSTIHMGDGCAVGALSVVLYDTRMGASSSLGALSLLMKGESLPAGSHWQGTPARRSNRVPGRMGSVSRRVPTLVPLRAA